MNLSVAVWAYLGYDKQINYALSSADMSTEGWVKVKDAEIRFDLLTKEEFATGAVPAMRKQKAQVYLDAEQEAQNIEEKIQSLLALEYNGEVAVVVAEGEPALDDDIPF